MAVASVMALAGCGAVNKSQFSSPFVSHTQSNLEANLEIGEKISGTASETCLFKLLCFGPTHFADNVDFNAGGQGGFFQLQGFEGVKVKNAAAYEAVSKSNADVIVAPRYTVESTDFLIFKTTSATVTGYKGTIKNIKQVPVK